MPTVIENPDTSLLPNKPFDGQRFLDRNGIEWIFNEELQCWMSNGRKSSVPVADEKTTGLLSRDLKKVLNNVDEKGGHFGIIVKPLLTLKPFNVKPRLIDKVLRVSTTPSGSTIWGNKPFVKDESGNFNPYISDRMSGLLLFFTTGKLKNRQFRILGNDTGRIFVEGDLSSARFEDAFEIYDIVDLNPHGILSGNIEVVSDSLDIRCVDGDFEEDDCESKPQDGLPPRGLNLTIKEEFLRSLCFDIPGCAGPRGDKGEKGEKGKDGTGDGPQGERGDAGLDAVVSQKFSGVKYIDVDDIYDTAVVALEPNPDEGKLYVVKAKVRVPGGDGRAALPADQVVASAINRSVVFDEELIFRVSKPLDGTDPIQTDSLRGVPINDVSGASCLFRSAYENDVLIAAFPKGGAADGEGSDITLLWLSDFMNLLTDFYRSKLEIAAAKYDEQIKEFILAKDTEARNVICDLAQQLAECEWELPLEFCVGLTKDDCAEDEQERTDFPFASALFGDEKYNDDSDPEAQLVSRPLVLGGELSHWPETPVAVRIDGKNATGREVSTEGRIVDSGATDLFSAGDYVLVWDGGAMFDYEYVQLGHWVGAINPNLGYGVRIRIVYPDGTEEIKPFPVPDILTGIRPGAISNPAGPLGAFCIKVPPGSPVPPEASGKQYFCDIKPFATGDPNSTPIWIEGAFAGFWSPGDIASSSPLAQVPKPGSPSYPSGGVGPSDKITPYDNDDVVEAYRNADILKKSITWTFDQSGGKVFLQCPILGSGVQPQFANRQLSIDDCISDKNIIKFKLYRVVNNVVNVNVF